MKKTYCDLCGKEMVEENRMSAYSKGYEILQLEECCDDCSTVFENSIKKFVEDRSNGK